MNVGAGLHAHGLGLDDRVTLDAAARSDVGRRRKVNEDSVLAGKRVFLVADGMGGHEAGDRASAAAVQAFAELATIDRGLTADEVLASLDDARAAVAAVARGTERGAGCTLTGVALIEHEGLPHWYVLNVGDSRVYQHSGLSLLQLTVDHSLQAEQAEAGAPGAASIPRNVITRALGSDDDRHDAWLLPVRQGMRLLLCSDGLTTELSDEQISAVLAVGGRAGSVADELIRFACEAGGRDNVSVV
ncbi:MAG: serine/threonine-protein phosphatase, partial [Actinobacteria bacterium]|nr:serine/threonine-protein phosphatase [Actinomycetota bacterium]